MNPLMQSLRVGKTAVALQFGGSKIAALSVVPTIAAIAWRRQFGKQYITDAITMYLVKGYLKGRVSMASNWLVKRLS